MGYDRNYMTVEMGRCGDFAKDYEDRARDAFAAFLNLTSDHRNDIRFVRSQMREALEEIDHYLDCARIWETRYHAMRDANAFMDGRKG